MFYRTGPEVPRTSFAPAAGDPAWLPAACLPVTSKGQDPRILPSTPTGFFSEMAFRKNWMISSRFRSSYWCAIYSGDSEFFTDIFPEPGFYGTEGKRFSVFGCIGVVAGIAMGKHVVAPFRKQSGELIEKTGATGRRPTMPSVMEMSTYCPLPVRTRGLQRHEDADGPRSFRLRQYRRSEHRVW